MLPASLVGVGEEAAQGVQFIPIAGQGITHIKTGPVCKRLLRTATAVARLMAAEHQNLIIDEVLFGDDQLAHYTRSLKDFTVYFIGIFCSLAVIEQRERARPDRYPGSARGQFDLVQEGTRIYDLKIDTEARSPENSAEIILRYVSEQPHPGAFLETTEKLAKTYL